MNNTVDQSLLLCTDMDRTILPNGEQAESTQARQCFHQFSRLAGVRLAYVTGRDRVLVEQAIGQYQLPTPDFAITDVGTRIYQIDGDNWHELEGWGEEIDGDWNGYEHSQLVALLDEVSELRIQEASKQNTHKLSYYLALDCDAESVIARVDTILKAKQIKASLIWSIDEPRSVGLLDILPSSASKLHALEYLAEYLQLNSQSVVFAGDSGNDLQVLASKHASVLVANASDEVREQALTMAQENDTGEALYCASGKYLGMNGNYSAGVLEGVWHFLPQFRDQLESMVER